MKKRLLTPLTVVLFFSGCAIGPDYQQPTVNMAEAFLYADSDGIDATSTIVTESSHAPWWHAFNDATLNNIVKDVQQQNISLQVAFERIKMAQNYKTIINSFKVPTVSIGAGYVNYQLSKNDSLAGPLFNPLNEFTPGLSPQIGNITLMDNQHDGLFAGATITWEIDLFGRINRQSKAADIRVEQAQIYQTGLTTLITADLIHNYLQYRGAEVRLELLKENIIDQQQTLTLVEKIVRSGYGSELDLAQAKAALATIESILPQLEIAQQVHKHRLAILLGESLSNITTRLNQGSGLPQIKQLIPVGLPSDLLLNRPDIRLAEREMAAINEEWAASVADQYPKFFLTGAPGVSASSFDDLFNNASFGWVGAAGIHWNVFDGGRGKAAEEMNQSRFHIASLNYQHTIDSAFAEVDSILFAYGRSQENQRRTNDALAATDNAVHKAKALYQAGLADYLTVLDAQRQQKLIQDRNVAAQLQSAQTVVALYKALGGDWEATSSQNE